MGILIQKVAEQTVNQEPTYVAYAKGEEVKEIKVYFDGDDFSLFDKTKNKFLKDEHGYPFFGRDKAEELLSDFVSNQNTVSV